MVSPWSALVIFQLNLLVEPLTQKPLQLLPPYNIEVHNNAVVYMLCEWLCQAYIMQQDNTVMSTQVSLEPTGCFVASCL